MNVSNKQIILSSAARFKSADVVADRFALSLIQSKDLQSISGDGSIILVKINLDSISCSKCLIATCMLSSKIDSDDILPNYISETLINHKRVVKIFYNFSTTNSPVVRSLLKNKQLYIKTDKDQKFKFSLMFKEYPVWSACISKQGDITKVINSVFLSKQNIKEQLCGD
ncbi:hypothetical protein [Mucilaginibacter sp.]